MKEVQLAAKKENKVIKNTEMVLSMMKGYLEMAQINLEEANLAPHTLMEGMALIEGK